MLGGLYCLLSHQIPHNTLLNSIIFPTFLPFLLQLGCMGVYVPHCEELRRPAGFRGHGIHVSLTLWSCLNNVSVAVGE